MNLRFSPTNLPEVIHITSDRFEDKRGWLSESYNKDVFNDNGITDLFIQEKHSFSNYKVLRGLHFQKDPFGQGKLVRCSSGSIFDVVVDIRPHSINCGKYIGIELSYDNGDMLYIPPGFAHGFVVISENGAGFNYHTTAHFNSSADSGISFRDGDINICWPFEVNEMIISDKDNHLPTLQEFLKTP
jgi:dTDP-4-dehydrorhamnose 3,5-epimerase